MIEYVRYILKQCKGKSVDEHKIILMKLYRDLEERGISHTGVYAMVNQIIINRLKKLREKLNRITRQ